MRLAASPATPPRAPSPSARSRSTRSSSLNTNSSSEATAMGSTSSAPLPSKTPPRPPTASRSRPKRKPSASHSTANKSKSRKRKRSTSTKATNPISRTKQNRLLQPRSPPILRSSTPTIPPAKTTKTSPGPPLPRTPSQLLLNALDKTFSIGIDDRMIADMPEFWRLYYQAAAAKAEIRPTDPAILHQNAVDQKAKLVSAIDPPSNEFAKPTASPEWLSTTP